MLRAGRVHNIRAQYRIRLSVVDLKQALTKIRLFKQDVTVCSDDQIRIIVLSRIADAEIVPSGKSEILSRRDHAHPFFIDKMFRKPLLAPVSGTVVHDDNMHVFPGLRRKDRLCTCGGFLVCFVI